MEANGEFVVTKQKNKDGIVTVNTCKSQLLYEIQGPYYYNPDVVAVLNDVKIEAVGENRVSVPHSFCPDSLCTFCRFHFFSFFPF